MRVVAITFAMLEKLHNSSKMGEPGPDRSEGEHVDGCSLVLRLKRPGAG